MDLYLVARKILFPIKIIVRNSKKETIQKTETHHVNVSVLSFLFFRIFDNG